MNVEEKAFTLPRRGDAVPDDSWDRQQGAHRALQSAYGVATVTRSLAVPCVQDTA